MKLLELFGGIGACSKALERLGIDYEIADYVEIDKYAVASYNAMHGTNFEPQDICKWDKDIEVDLVMHGSPCQDFSLAGLQAGGDEGSGTRSSLMYETIRIVDKLRPKYVIWENVKNVISKKHIHNFNNYIERMRQLGYTSYYQVLNAKDYGIPQNRERVFTISIKNDLNKGFVFPQKQELKLKLKDMLEDNVDEKYYLSDKMISYISATGTANFKNPDSKINLDIARPLTTDQNKRAGTTNYLSNDLPSNYDLNEVVRKYGVFDTENKKHQAGSVYDENGLSPTLDTMQGGYRQSCIEIRTILLKNKGSEITRETEVSNTLLARDYKGFGNQEMNAVMYIKNATKKGYLEASEGDGVDISSRIEYHRGTVQKESSQTLDTKCNVGVVVKQLKIRKLTPKECWRLMGFDDIDFEKASKVNSNTQLYKQAGNSIVVNVLEAILYNLLVEPSTNNENIIEGQTNIFDFIRY